MKYLKMQTIDGGKQYWKKIDFFLFSQIVYARTVIFIFFVLFNDVHYLWHYCENNKKTAMMVCIMLRRIKHLFLDTDFIGKLCQ